MIDTLQNSSQPYLRVLKRIRYLEFDVRPSASLADSHGWNHGRDATFRMRVRNPESNGPKQADSTPNAWIVTGGVRAGAVRDGILP
jgi:hypothetical protein